MYSIFWILVILGIWVCGALGVIPAYLPSGKASDHPSAPLSTQDCSDNEVLKCASNAEDLLKDSNLVFPDSQASLDKVCSMWSNFTDCIVRYTARCLSRNQITSFERSFKEPVSSMNLLCQDKEYRKEYLNYAPCIKEVSTNEYYCGNQYRFLIDHVTGSSATIKQICCARAKFKSCIIMKTEEKCEKGRKTPSTRSGSFILPGQSGKIFYQNSTAFAVRTLDKSLAFVAQQCYLISFGDDECPGIDPKLFRPNNKGPILGLEIDPVLSSASNSNSNSGALSSQQQNSANLNQKPVNPLDYSQLKQVPTPAPNPNSNYPPNSNPNDKDQDGGGKESWGNSPPLSNRVTETQINRIIGEGSSGAGALKKGSTTHRTITTQRPLNKESSGLNLPAHSPKISIAISILITLYLTNILSSN